MAKLSDYVDQGSTTSEIKLLDSITTSATATYALTKNGTAYSPESARNLIVSLNGVTQAPQDAYTVSGSNIVFDSALTSADVIDYILVIGSAISIGTPSDGTVGTAQMSYPLGNFSSTGIDDNATSTAVTIDSSGNLLMNTTKEIQFYASTYGIRASTGLEIKTGDFTRFLKGSTEYMRIDTSGNVGIGTTSPVAGTKLTLNDSAFGGMQFQSGGSDCGYIGVNTNTLYIGGGEKIVFHTGQAQAVDGSERMRLDASGDLLLSRTYGNPNSSSFGMNLQAGGRILAAHNGGGSDTAHQLYGNAGSVRIMGDGDLRNTNNSYGALSDERLKSNIVNASSQLDDIMTVQVRSYTLDSTGDTHIGVVAQELEASGMSGLVDEDSEGMKSVKYSVLYMKATKALQEAVTRIETLEAEVAELKAGD